MTQIEVMFLKDGTQYGYRQASGTKGKVYTNDIPFLVANGVIEEMQAVDVDGNESYKPNKKTLWQKLFG